MELQSVTQFPLPGVEKALSEGCRMHAFRSGGGLRVIRLSKDEQLKGYGEHPNVEEALAYSDEDYLAGGREYDDVYGGKYPHYLTGSSTPSSTLDAWVLDGKTFDAWKEGDDIIFQLQGMEEPKWPEDLHTRLAKEGSYTITTSRGVVHRVEPIRFANGEVGASMAVISKPEGMSDIQTHMWWITKTGRAKTFWDAVEAAFAASSIEIPGS